MNVLEFTHSSSIPYSICIPRPKVDLGLRIFRQRRFGSPHLRRGRFGSPHLAPTAIWLSASFANGDLAFRMFS
jgi:hypothetical protein